MEKPFAGETDDALVRRAAAGDRGAFGQLVARYERPMTALVSRMTENAEEVDDVVQELFVRAWRGLARFRGDAQFSTWLYRIGVNTAIKHRSRRRAERAQSVSVEELTNGLESLPSRSEKDDPFLAAQRREQEEKVRRAVQKLPEKQRAVVVLHYFEGLSCEEIGQVLECSVGTVWSRLHYACKRLKSTLENWDVTPG